jgi:hypothetical protein
MQGLPPLSLRIGRYKVCKTFDSRQIQFPIIKCPAGKLPRRRGPQTIGLGKLVANGN